MSGFTKSVIFIAPSIRIENKRVTGSWSSWYLGKFFLSKIICTKRSKRLNKKVHVPNESPDFKLTTYGIHEVGPVPSFERVKSAIPNALRQIPRKKKMYRFKSSCLFRCCIRNSIHRNILISIIVFFCYNFFVKGRILNFISKKNQCLT